MPKPIGELLVEAGVLTDAQLEEVLARQRTEGEERIASELFALGLVHERALCEALAERHGDPALVLSASVLDLGALGLIPRIIAERHMLLPVAIDEESITIAVPDGELGPILEQVQFASGRRVVAVVAVRKIVADAIGPAYEASRRGESILAGHHAKDRAPVPHLEIVRAVPADSEPAHQALAEALVEESHDDTSIDLLAPGHVAGMMKGEAPPPVELPPPPDDDSSGGVPLARIALKRVPVLRPAPEPSMPPPAVEAVDVVLAEDDPAIAELIIKVLGHDGYEVRHADSGSSAVELLRSVRPRLILLDAMLPGVHGFEICARAKGSETYRSTPIIMISAVYKGWEQQRDIQEVHGADAFVEKPFDIHFLRKLVAGYLGKQLDRAPLAGEAASRVHELRTQVGEALALGDVDAADALARQWVSQDPFDSAAYLEIGNIAAHRGDLPQALKAYEFAVVYNPQSFVTRANLAMVYERLGFVRRAINTWEAAGRLAPDAASRANVDARAAALRR